MPDFTSALYLGLRHSAEALRPWAALTTGAPAALRPVPGAALAQRRLAALQGAGAATLMPSTVHVAWDLGSCWDPRRDVVEVDAHAYPVLALAAQLAAARGVPVWRFGGDDDGSPARWRGRRPIVIVDGLCPACGGVAPLGRYVAAVRSHGGVVVVDDTQAIGILGEHGGGSLPFHDLTGAGDVLVVASMAKALGVPVAAVSGAPAAVAAYERHSSARVHCSPPSVVVLRALAHALDVNEACGGALRTRLAGAIRRFRAGLRRLGVRTSGGCFPMQALPVLSRREAASLHNRLLAAGVQTVVQARGDGGRIVFLLTARHSPADIDAALAALEGAPELGRLARAAVTV